MMMRGGIRCSLLVVLALGLRISSAQEKSMEDKNMDERSENPITCSQSPSANRISSSEQLELLREQMSARNISAYMMPMDDAARIKWISGFSGTQGKVVVTLDKAALWTDGRYFLQAQNQLDCYWRLVKEGEDDEPSIGEWIMDNISESDRAGSDPQLLGAKAWLEYAGDLEPIVLESVSENLIDLVRTDNYTKTDKRIVDHPITLAGKERTNKINELREALRKQKYLGMVITQEDEVAWLFNLRGEKDISVEDMVNRKPTFESLVYLPAADNETIHFWCNVSQFLDPSILTNETDFDIEIEDMSMASGSLRDLVSSMAEDSKILIPSKSVYEPGASYAVYEIIGVKGELGVSPIIEAKAIKNEVEIEGMKNAHIRDAVALIEFVSFLEDCIQNKKEQNWTEINAAATLFEIRKKKELNKGLSFTTISGFGSNGAVIHYRPEESTNKALDNSSLYLLDSGGQYMDGTTDVTRTFHFGEPTEEHIQMYTRVLAAAIDIALVTAPVGVIDRNIDYAARKHFYNIGKDYRHGTGHGIGSYLNVHEGPTRVAMENGGDKIKPGMFFSDEPGYYEDGCFGIRLETILMAFENLSFANSSFGPFLSFEPITLVPFEPKLIDKTYLTLPQRTWLQDYNEMLNQTIAPLLAHDELASEYLKERTSENYLE